MLSSIGVSTYPGLTQLNLIFCPAYSEASDFMSDIKAPLDAAYAVLPEAPYCPATDAIPTIESFPCSWFLFFTSSRVISQKASRLTDIISCRSSSSVILKGMVFSIPAQWTKPLSGPARAAAFVTSSLQFSGVNGMAMALCPSPVSSESAAFRRVSSRPFITHCAPSAEASFAAALPMPEEAPVIRIFRPSRVNGESAMSFMPSGLLCPVRF